MKLLIRVVIVVVVVVVEFGGGGGITVDIAVVFAPLPVFYSSSVRGNNYCYRTRVILSTIEVTTPIAPGGVRKRTCSPASHSTT